MQNGLETATERSATVISLRKPSFPTLLLTSTALLSADAPLPCQGYFRLPSTSPATGLPAAVRSTNSYSPPETAEWDMITAEAAQPPPLVSGIHSRFGSYNFLYGGSQNRRYVHIPRVHGRNRYRRFCRDYDGQSTRFRGSFRHFRPAYPGEHVRHPGVRVQRDASDLRTLTYPDRQHRGKYRHDACL